jgi:hypothetical protein
VTDPAQRGEEAWPEGVERVSLEALGRFGIDRNNGLYWDGRPVEVRRPLVLSAWQKAWAAVVGVLVALGALGSLVSGLTAGLDSGCTRQWLPVALCRPPPGLRIAGPARQPCRAFMRGFVLLMM